MLREYSSKCSRNSKKYKLKKGKDNLLELFGKFYLKFEKNFNKIC